MDADLQDVESLTLCSFCKQKFNSTTLCPKILQCKHYFCLRCIETTMIQAEELTCVHCWKRQEILNGGAILLPTHTPVLSLANHLTLLQMSDTEDKKNSKACLAHGQSWTLWCHNCHKELCRMCYLMIEHTGHHVTSNTEARELLGNVVQTELTVVSKLLQEINRLSGHQREFQLQVIEACVAIKTYLETDLAASCAAAPELREARDILQRARPNFLELTSLGDLQTCFENVTSEKHRLETRYQELALQCKMEEIVSTAGVVLDIPAIANAALQSTELPIKGPTSPGLNSTSPLLLLANYCMYQLYTRHLPSKPASPVPATRAIGHNLPQYYFNVEINQVFVGRFVIETRADLAPKMAKNFDALVLGEMGHSYKNCCVFQCWEGESIITGDYEFNNGRGGRAICEEGCFMPDETKLAPLRGAVGMRRSQKKHDNLGLVGSQFRIILQDMRGFSAIFAHVVEGIEVVEKIASCGDQTGKPTKNIVIVSCGKN